MMVFIPVWLKTTQDRHLAVLRSQSKVNISACCNYGNHISYNLKKKNVGSLTDVVVSGSTVFFEAVVSWVPFLPFGDVCNLNA